MYGRTERLGIGVEAAGFAILSTQNSFSRELPQGLQLGPVRKPS